MGDALIDKASNLVNDFSMVFPANARENVDNLLWSQRKITVVLKREGLLCSVSTVGRSLAKLFQCGAVVAAPILRRKPTARRIRFTT